MPAHRLSDLPNLGPKSEAMLAAIGVHDRDDLASRGAVAAYVALKRSGQPVSLNMLWALEAALTGRPWQDVARNDRLRLLLELEAHEGKRQ